VDNGQLVKEGQALQDLPGVARRVSLGRRAKLLYHLRQGTADNLLQEDPETARSSLILGDLLPAEAWDGVVA